jgi:choline-sulfatase
MLGALSLLPLLLPSPPNVILITIDDLNDWVGCLDGHPQARTPSLDALAGRGTLFTNAHCQAPVCTPSRASLFTGRLPSTTGMYFLQPNLSQVTGLAEVTTLVERFAAEGYATLGAGKLYHGQESRYFQTYGGAMGGLGPRPPEKLAYPEGHPLWDWGPYPATDAQMPDTKLADWAIARLAEEREAPFLLAVGFWRPHVPMYVPAPWFDSFEEEITLPATRADDRDDLPRYATELTVGHPAPRHEWMVEHDAWRDAVHAYLASCSFVDHQVGRVLRALAASDHADDTIVVLLSDHGFHLGEKQRWAKRSLWEESTRVPLILAGPGIPVGRRDAGVGLVDVYPTLLELCGLREQPALDGHSLVPLLREEPWPHAALTTFGPGNHAVRTQRWRYIRYADGSEELYAHPADGHEWHNLADDPAHAATCTTLRAFLPVTSAPLVPGAAGAGWDAMQAATR